MAVVFKNNAKTTLASGINSSATSITVSDGDVFPSLTGSDIFFVTFDDGTNNEIVKVTARSGNTLTVVRAQESTTARSFSTGDEAQLRLTAGILGLFSQTGVAITDEIEAYLDANGLTFPDNVKAQFGANNDLQIFHNGTVSNIKDAGTGILQLTTNGDAVQIYDTANFTTMARFNTGGAVTLNHAGTQKFQTTANGINVDGTTISDAETAFSTTANTPNASLIVGNTASTSANGNYKGAVGFSRGSNTIQVRSAIVGKQTHTSANRQGLAFLVHPDTVAGTLNEALLINHDSTASFSGALQINGTTVIDSSRNLTNIGTITSSGNATFNGSVNKFTGDVEIEHNPLILDTNPSNSYGVTEALRIDDSGGTNDRALQIFELLHSGARSHRLTFNTNITTDGSAYTYTQGNYGGSSQIEFGNSGPIVFYTNTQNTGGSTTAITPIERLRIKETGEVQVQGELETGGLLKLDYTNPTLTLRPDNSAHFNIKANESPVRLELGHSVNKNLYLSNTGGATFNYDLNVVSDFKINGTTVIDSSRNISNIGTISSGTITSSGNIDVNSDSGQLQFGADNDMQIFHNGANGEINNATGNFIIDSAGDITLDADGADIFFADAGTNFAQFRNSSNSLRIDTLISNADIIFRGNDGGSTITALTLDMSNAGSATFNKDIFIGDGNPIRFGDDQDGRVFYDDTNGFIIQNATSDKDILFKGNDGGSTVTALTLDMSAGGQLLAEGTASNSVPKYSFQGDTNTGLGYIGADQVGLIVGGSRVFYVSAGSSKAFFQNLSNGVEINNGLNVGSGVYQVAGTTVIDGSRNLTNIGTITSTGRHLIQSGNLQMNNGDNSHRYYYVATSSGGGDFLLGQIRHNSSVDGAIEGTVCFAYDYGTTSESPKIHFSFAQRSGTARGKWWYEHDDDAAGSNNVKVVLIDDGSGGMYVWLRVGDFARISLNVITRQGSNWTASGTLSSGTITTGTTLFDTSNDPTSEHHIGKLFAHGDSEIEGQLTIGSGNNIVNAGNMTIDVAGDLTLDVDGQDILFKDGGTQFGSIRKNGNNLQLMASIQDGDITFHGNDGGSAITALTLDMSAGGNATFAGTISASGNITQTVAGSNYFRSIASSTGNAGLLMRNTVRDWYILNNSAGTLELYDGTANAVRMSINTSGNTTFAGTISGTLASSVTATTQSAGDNSTKVATTAYTDTAIANLADSAPSTLNTLNELAAALGDDANFSTTVTNSIATKLPLAGGTMTGNLTLNGADIVKSGSADLTVDVGGRINLSADDNGEIRLYDGSSLYGQFKDDDDRLSIQGLIQDKDMLFVVNDGGSMTTALKLDAADGGDATFYGTISSGAITSTGQVKAQSLFIDSGGYTPQDAEGQEFKYYLVSQGTDQNFKKVADVTISTGNYKALALRVVLESQAGNFGNTIAVDKTEYVCNFYRSAESQDSVDSAVISGQDPTHHNLRIVKTATGVYELQVRQNANYKDAILKLEVLSTNGGTFTVTDGNVNGSTSGTITTPTSVESASTYSFNKVDTPFLNIQNTIKVNSTQILDSARNLSNIGTISSGGITSTGNLSLTTTGSEIMLDAYNTSQEGGGIFFREGFQSSNKYNLSIIARSRSNDGSADGLSINGYEGVFFSTGSNSYQERFGIDVSGNISVGGTTILNQSRNLTNIGTGSFGNVVTALAYQISGTEVINSSRNLTNIGNIGSTKYNINSEGGGTLFQTDGYLRFANGNTETARIDSSGNLLVGKTSSGLNTAGVEFASSGRSRFTRDGNNVAEFNRKTSDGSIVSFNKDATAIGVIGTKSGDLIAGTGDTGIRFDDANNAIYAHNTSTNAYVDDAISLGFAGIRFKDLHLSGDISLPYGSINDSGTDLVIHGTNAVVLKTDGGTAITIPNNSTDINLGSGKLNFSRTSEAILLDSAHSKTKIGLFGGIGTGAEYIGTSANTVEISGTNINFNGASGSGTPNLKMGTTTVIDSSRNLTNIGTITASGDITTDDRIISKESSGGFYKLHTDGTFRAAFYDDNGNTAIYADGDGSNPFITFSGGATHTTDIDGILNLSNTNASLRIGGTEVISTGRNLSNIGTISSGAITTSGNFNQTGGTFLTHGDEVSNLTTAWQAAGTSKNRGLYPFRYQNGATGQPESGNNANWGLNIYAHAGSGGNYPYGTQFAMGSSQNLFFRWFSNGSAQDWKEVVTANTSGNVVLDGGITSSGTIQSNNGSIISHSTGEAQVKLTSTAGVDNTSYVFNSDTGFGTYNQTDAHFYWFYDRSASNFNVYAGSSLITRANSSGLQVHTGGYYIAGTEVITSSRNLTNIGTIDCTNITCGNVTPSGEIFLGNAKEINFAKADGSNDGTKIERFGGNALRFRYAGNSCIFDSLGNNPFSIRNSNDSVIFEVSPNSTHANSTTNINNGVLQIAGTTVINGSRNLTNITGGTFTSGRLNFHQANVQAPTSSNATTGARLNLYPLGSGRDYTIGIENSHMWFNTDGGYKFYEDGSIRVTFSSGGNVTATGDVTAFSDERLKDNIQTLDGKKALQMRGVSFTKDGKQGSGVIAQEVEKIAPELVLTADDEMGTKSVAYGNLVGYLIEAIKDQQDQIEYMKSEIKVLKEANNGNK